MMQPMTPGAMTAANLYKRNKPETVNITIVTWMGSSAVYVNGNRVTSEGGCDHDEVGWSRVWQQVLDHIPGPTEFEVNSIGFDDYDEPFIYFPDTLEEVKELKGSA